MRTIAAIRTHNWDEDAQRLHARLHPVFGDDLVVVFHNRPRGLRLPSPVVDLNDRWLNRNGLRVLADYGWRCGDYFFYALRATHPGYDAYWLIEPDVAFTSDPAPFFRTLADNAADALAYRPVDYPVTARFGAGVPGLRPKKAIFALTRLSGRAIDRLFQLRRDYSAGPVGRKDFANDEVFVHSHMAADPDLTSVDLADAIPGWFDGVQFLTDPDLLQDWVNANAPPGRVLHPVRGRASFRRALASRLAANTGYLIRMREALAMLDGDDLDEIAIDAAQHLRAALQAQVEMAAAGPRADLAPASGTSPVRRALRRARRRAVQEADR